MHTELDRCLKVLDNTTKQLNVVRNSEDTNTKAVELDKEKLLSYIGICEGELRRLRRCLERRR